MKYDAASLERVAQQFRYDMWRSVTPDAVIESGVEVRRFGPVQATAFGDLPEQYSLNQIQGAAEPGAVGEGHLARAIEWMRAREVDYRVPVANGRPGTVEAESWLNERGYERGSGWVKLVREATWPDLPENPDVVVYELGENDADGEGLSAIVAEVLDFPVTAGTLFFSLPQEDRWRCYTAVLAPGDEVVATGSMLIQDGVAQLGPGMTLEHARGQGCNTALLRRRLTDAVKAGCHTVFVELGEFDPSGLSAAYRNLRRAGFEEAYESRNWQRPALHPARLGGLRFSG
jgi:GNAT superfamily N-acetyltransferase